MCQRSPDTVVNDDVNRTGENMPDIEKLRRFSLSAALVLIFYSAAGVSLDAGAKASIFGIPFVIKKPNLLLVGFFDCINIRSNQILLLCNNAQ